MSKAIINSPVVRATSFLIGDITGVNYLRIAGAFHIFCLRTGRLGRCLCWSAVVLRLFAAVAVCFTLQAVAVPYGDATIPQASRAQEIRLGQTLPYTGPAAALGVIGKVQAAYFEMINKSGGINGRRIVFFSMDDAGDPRKTRELTRKLVEKQDVLAIVGTQGEEANGAIQEYLNAARIPQLFVGSRSQRIADPVHFPWTMGIAPTYATEAAVYVQYALKSLPNIRIGVLRGDDEAGHGYLQGVRDVLGDRAHDLIVKDVTALPDTAAVESEVSELQSSGANVFINVASPALSLVALRRAAKIGWRPLQFVSMDVAASVAGWPKADADLATGLISMRYLKDPRDPTWGGFRRHRFQFEEFSRWASDPEAEKYERIFIERYAPGVDPHDPLVISAYNVADLTVRLLIACGSEITRARIMGYAANLRGVALPLVNPGILLNTDATRYTPITQGQLIRFQGAAATEFGAVLDSAPPSGDAWITAH
jgi:branched-chain amino acid transport system substrate-binding protein